MTGFREKSINAWTEDSIRHIATPSAFARSTLFYIQEIGYFRTLEPYFTEREHVNSFLIVYTLSGQGRLTYRGKTYRLLPNDVFFIDCMEYQHYQTEISSTWDLLWVHANGISLRGYYEQFDAGGYPVLTLTEESKIPTLLWKMIHNQQQKSTRMELINSQLLLELLTELLLNTHELELASSERPRYIEDILKQLDEEFYRNISLDQLAKQYSVSKYHLAKEFKKYTGFPPNEYLINTRITQAKELLKYSGLSVADVAKQVGIQNVSHFINLFNHRVEQTPLAFRKKWQTPATK